MPSSLFYRTKLQRGYWRIDDEIKGPLQPKIVTQTATVVSPQQIMVEHQRYTMDSSTTGASVGDTLTVTNVGRAAVAVYVPANASGVVSSGGGGGSGASGITQVKGGPDVSVSQSGTIATVVRKGNSILLFSGTGVILGEYATVALAHVAAASGDVVQLPAGTNTETIPQVAGVILRGVGRKATTLTELVTGADSSTLEDLSIIRTSDDATKLIGFLGPVSGDSYINDCEIVVTQIGAGTGYGISIQAGNVYVQGGRLVGSTAQTDET